MLNIHVNSTPRHLKVTPTMVDDFLIDPVMGLKVIMGIECDAFQANRVRTYWWVPDVMDSSGVGTGKTIAAWAALNLRAVLLGDQHMGVYYQFFDSGKRNFWKYYRIIRHPLFRAQLGKVDLLGEKEGKANTQGPACFMQWFKNDSVILMPAPNWNQEAEGQAGTDLNVALLDEWTKSERISKGRDGTAGDSGINKQILARVRRYSRNQHHPLWGNHRLFTASAESPNHPGWARYQAFQREIAKGNPKFACISYSYKDYSGRRTSTGRSYRETYRDENMYLSLKAQVTAAEFKRQALGLWAKETRGWYSEEAIRRCVENGITAGLEPMTERAATMGA